ncbi:uncharacterized protein [Physcomitrium patens]|uniref:uncharacterized protein isoform X2 n=1 Tax=Physcomitrium patens TaxID=3218 RepID=UPI003CCDB26C
MPGAVIPPMQPAFSVVHFEKGEMKKEDAQSVGHVAKVASKVAVIYNGEKKFTTGPVDIALNRYATSEGDAILVVAFLEHILSPMGLRMVADLQLFSGVNEAVLKQTIIIMKKDLETKLDNCLQVCRTKKIL